MPMGRAMLGPIDPARRIDYPGIEPTPRAPAPRRP